MKDSLDVINEAFFKKQSYQDKMNKKLSKYEPVGNSGDAKPHGFGSVGSFGSGGLAITDTDEVKKRLTGAFGASFGRNSIKSLASKSIKTFPIIISDNIEADTAVNIKKLVEEQYAEYISLLINNQVIDVADFGTAEAGGANIAIQAIERLTGASTDKRGEITRKSMDGTLGFMDLIKGASMYNLIRNESEATFDDETLSALFEDAVVVPKESAEDVIDFMNENLVDIMDTVSEGDASYEIIKPVGREKETGLVGELINEGYLQEGNTYVIGAIRNQNNGEKDDVYIRYLKDELKKASGTLAKANNDITSAELTAQAKIAQAERDRQHASSMDSLKLDRKIDGFNNSVATANREARHRDELSKYASAVDRERQKHRDYVRDKLEASRIEAERVKNVEIREKMLQRIDELTKKHDELIAAQDSKFEEKEKKLKDRISELEDVIQNPGDIEKGTMILLSKDKLETTLGKTVKDILSAKENAEIKNKFTTATFLLQSNNISGHEYISYVSERLGLPISEEVRRVVTLKYKASNVVSSELGQGKFSLTVSRENRQRLEGNLKTSNKIFNKMLGVNILTVAKSAAIGGTLGLVGYGAYKAATALAGGSTVASIATTGTTVAVSSFVLSNPILVAALVPAAIGVSATLLASVLKQRKYNRELAYNRNRTTGWERVEHLIQQIEAGRDEISLSGTNRANKFELAKSEKESEFEFEKQRQADELKYQQSLVTDYYDKHRLLETVDDTDVPEENFNGKVYYHCMSEEAMGAEVPYTFDAISEVLREGTSTIDLRDELMNAGIKPQEISEATSTTTFPIQLKKTYEYNPKDKGKIIVAPAFGARSAQAYGTVEYDRREIKDRKYNSPLIMSVTFRERYSDGTFADNELTAVIGILGVITRIPSDEMKFILEQNTEGSVLKGIFKSEGGAKNSLTDILGVSKLKREMQALPQSIDVWKNLEKVKTLALANTISGKANDNIANAHIIFSQKEIDECRGSTGIDYLKDRKNVSELMKRYSAINIMVANDISEKLFVFDDIDAISWNIIPYSEIRGKTSGDQLTSALLKLGRL